MLNQACLNSLCPLDKLQNLPTFFFRLVAFYYYYFTPWEFFTWALADGFILEFERQQVSSYLHDSLRYSDRSQLCSRLDGLHSSRYFQVLQSRYQSFGDCIKSTNYNFSNCEFHVPLFFQFSSEVQILFLLFTFFQFYYVVSRVSKVHNSANSLFFFFFFFFC